VICQHEPTDPMIHWDIWAFLGQSDLNTRRSPRDESCKSALPDPKKTLVNIGRINITLDDVQNGNITALLPRYSGDHSVLWLKESSHHIQDGGFANSFSLLDTIAREGCIRSHEEVTPRGRDQGCNDADQIVVHITRISEGSSTS
jgi:hypothetical protein